MTMASDAVLSAGGMAPGVEHVAPADILTPADRYQELFVAVQSARVFADSKTFPDCIPRRDPEVILARYRSDHALPGFDLKQFVDRHFEAEAAYQSHYSADPTQSISDHIDDLWAVLTRTPSRQPPYSSLLPLPKPYLVPGGRFSEMYYWDSFFTMLGLEASGGHKMAAQMADNFAFLIDNYGHVPNGNRSYYLSRSQPPVFALMVELFHRHGVKRDVHYLPQLQREYAYWMAGSETGTLRAGDAVRHVVGLPENAVLNRYWDERDTPREEGFLEDQATASASSRPAAEVYRDLRAGAATGWDFSSRWLSDPNDLSTICTTSLLPVDLNAFMYALEQQIGRLLHTVGNSTESHQFMERAKARKQAMDRYLWDSAQGVYVDYDWRHGRQREQISAATATPLYVGMASAAQAAAVAAAIERDLLAPGGLRTTNQPSPQQWDRSNGWAPLQWMAIDGLARYGHHDIAQTLTERWLSTVGAVYTKEAKLVEKYALDHQSDDGARGGAGGEYPLQDGFGWTNGVTRRLLAAHPTHHVHHARPGRRR